MTKSIPLGVLDQSPIRRGATTGDAIRESLELARACDRWGYHRYWVAEHHASNGLAGSAPEILITRIAAETKDMRIGSGGVMLNHYSPLKVAETFRMLETLYPGRIDLGLGRAPGSDQRTAAALQLSPEAAGADSFAPKLGMLLGYLDGTLPENHPYSRIRVMPEPAQQPELWLLGSSDFSAAYAAHIGSAFSFAQFITGSGGEAVVRAYKEGFKPSHRLAKPLASISTFVLCADTEEEAKRLAASRKLWLLNFFTGREQPYPMVEEALAYPYTEAEEDLLRRSGRRSIVGNPDQVKAGLLELAETYAADELSIVTICAEFAARMRSYELIAKAFGLRAD